MLRKCRMAIALSVAASKLPVESFCIKEKWLLGRTHPALDTGRFVQCRLAVTRRPGNAAP